MKLTVVGSTIAFGYPTTTQGALLHYQTVLKPVINSDYDSVTGSTSGAADGMYKQTTTISSCSSFGYRGRLHLTHSVRLFVDTEFNENMSRNVVGVYFTNNQSDELQVTALFRRDGCLITVKSAEVKQVG